MFKKNKNKKKPQAAPSASDIARQAELQEENDHLLKFIPITSVLALSTAVLCIYTVIHVT